MILGDPFAAIGDATRRHILEELRRRPSTVGELAKGLPVSRPAVSQHLKILLDAGLVTVDSAGTRRIYALNGAGLNRLNLWMDQFWRD